MFVHHWPSCLKLTTSLINETLKFQTYAKTLSFFATKCKEFCNALCQSFSYFFSAKTITTVDFMSQT